jgi:hypothetical protein
MANQKKNNDVAQALAALAGGAVPSESETPSGGIPSETTVFGPSFTPAATPAPIHTAPDEPAGSEAVARLRAPSPPAFPTPQPPVEGLQRPHLPTISPPPDMGGKSTGALVDGLREDRIRSARASVPLAAPPVRVPPISPDERQARIRPATPQRSVETPIDSTESRGESEGESEEERESDFLPDIVEDDETIAAAPDASAFAPRVARKPAQARIYANLFYRRTIIPILLTCGVMLPSIGVWSMLDGNAPLADIGTGVEVLLIVVGAVLFVLGMLNAFHVRHILAMAAKR